MRCGKGLVTSDLVAKIVLPIRTRAGAAVAKSSCELKVLHSIVPGKSRVPEAYTNGEGGRNLLRFLFVFSPFFPIEKTRYRPKDLILEIGLGRIKRGDQIF